jgi:hypothetical protein
MLAGNIWASPRNPYLEKPLHKVKDKFAELGTLQSPENVGMLVALALSSSLAAARLRLATMSRHAAAIHADVTGVHAPPRTWAFAPVDSWSSPVDVVSADRTAELTQLTAHRRHHLSPVLFPNGPTQTEGFLKWFWDWARCTLGAFPRCTLGAFHGSILTLSSWWICQS